MLFEKPPTKQELFDHVAVHLLTQKAQSKTMGGSCKYRLNETAGDPIRCAVGCLIDDLHYNPDYEGKIFGSDDVRIAVERSIGRPLEGFNNGIDDKTEVHLLGDLQVLHDGSAEPDNWHDQLLTMADKYQLSSAAIRKAEGP